MRHQRGSDVEEIALLVCDQYAIQGDLFSEAVLGERAVPTQIEDAVANMRVIEAVVASARQSTWV
jgi:predicted dehydrogenase